MSDLTKDQVVEWLSGQSVIEIAELVKELEEKWGVSAAAPAAVAVAAPAAGGDSGGAAEEKTEFDVVLTEFGGNKIAVIKESTWHHWTRFERSKRTCRRCSKTS